MRKRNKRFALGAVEEDILEQLSTGDFLMSFLLSGRSTRAFYREAGKRARARFRDKRSIERLKDRGLLLQSGDLLALTQKGRDMLELLHSKTMPVTSRWSGRWWIVLYDIPVSASAFRFELRRRLIRGGFRKLQHSVWIYPHPSRELEIFLKHNPMITRYVRYLEVLPFSGLTTVAEWRRLPKS